MEHLDRFLNTLAPIQFERFCADLLTKEGYAVSTTGQAQDVGVDIIAIAPTTAEKWAVECKHTVRPGLILDINTRRLLLARDYLGASRALLITSASIPSPYTTAVSRAHGITIWDRAVLRAMLSRHPELQSLHVAPNSEQPRHQVISTGGSSTESSRSAARGLELAQQLRDLGRGKEHWRAFEDLGVEILNHLFVPPLSPPRIQSSSQDGLDRRDAIYGIGNGNSLWDRIQTHHRTRMIVVDFKNLTNEPTQRDVESIQQYLYPKAFRSVGLLCTRARPSPEAITARRRTWAEAEKLVIFVWDEMLEEMIDLKQRGDDPAVIIDSQIYDFFLTLAP